MDANRTRTKIHPLVAELMGCLLDDLPITNLREINDHLQNGTGSHHEVQAQLLKEAKQRGDDLRAIAEARELRCLDLEKTLALREEQVLDLTEENNNHRAYADRQQEKLEARDEYIKGADYKIALHQLMERAGRPSANATQSPSIEAQKKIITGLRADKKIITRERNEDKQRIKSLEKQIMIDTRERNEANRTIADQKHTIDRYIARFQFVIRKLLLPEQITRLTDYIKNEELSGGDPS